MQKSNSTRKLIVTIILWTLFIGCDDRSIKPLKHKGAIAKFQEEQLFYKSIIGRKGDVYVNRGSEVIVYKDYKIIYSSSDALTLFIESKEGDEVYIQGPAVVELKSGLRSRFRDSMRRDSSSGPNFTE